MRMEAREGFIVFGHPDGDYAQEWMTFMRPEQFPE